MAAAPDIPLPATSSGSGDNAMNLTFDQRQVIQAVERVGASLSLVGVVLIFVTFAAFKRLRTVPNTFILFASVANVGASVACLIGYAGLSAGDASPLCQVQAFLLEMFMQSDPWWSFAMAVNVYMVFFLAANPNSFRRYLWIYCLVCYGAPAIPALICLAIRQDSRGLIYGNATLWCWIGDSWNSLRIFTYYMPIWVCILLSALIYIAVGYHVFHQRNQLRNLTLSNQGKDISTSDIRQSGEKNYVRQPGCYGTVTTDIQVTAEALEHQASPHTPTPSIAPMTPVSHYALHPWDCPSHDLESATRPSRTDSIPTAKTATFTTVSSVSSAHAVRVATKKLNKQQKPYTRGQSGWWQEIRQQLRRMSPHQFVAKFRHLDPVKLAYLRTSFVFAISVLVTWTPSSINRVYTLVYPQRFNYALNVASAVVLPLQGVWNAIIYCATSWTMLGQEMADCSWLPCGGWSGRRASNASSVSRFAPSERRGTVVSERFPRGVWAPGDDGIALELCARPSIVRVARDGSF